MQLASDQRVFLRVGWKGLKTLLAARGDASVPRVSYLDGVLELTAPSRSHESRSWLIGRLLEVWADENEVLLEGLKSWTLKNEGKEAGAEPDECWVVGDRPHATKPDLALEVVQSHGGLDKPPRRVVRRHRATHPAESSSVDGTPAAKRRAAWLQRPPETKRKKEARGSSASSRTPLPES